MNRDTLARLLTSLEDRYQNADPLQRPQLDKDLKKVRWALYWHEQYEAGPSAFAWQGGRVVPVLLLAVGAPFIWGIVKNGWPTLGHAMLSAVMMGLTMALGLVLLRHGWHTAAREYRKVLERAEQLLLKEPTQRP